MSELMMNFDFPEGTLIVKTTKNVQEIAQKKAGGSQQAATEIAVKMLMDPETI